MSSDYRDEHYDTHGGDYPYDARGMILFSPDYPGGRKKTVEYASDEGKRFAQSDYPYAVAQGNELTQLAEKTFQKWHRLFYSPACIEALDTMSIREYYEKNPTCEIAHPTG